MSSSSARWSCGKPCGNGSKSIEKDEGYCLTNCWKSLDSDFLQELFKENYKHKYSLTGSGIYNLVLIDNKIYEVDFKTTTKLLDNDGKKAFRDATKDTIVNMIVNKLKDNNVDCTVNSGKFITFKHFGNIFKIEITKKAAMPN